MTGQTEKKKKIFSTHEIAEMLGVHRTTVNNWINEGRLRGFSTPGGHRRVKKSILIDFLNKNDIPCPDELDCSDLFKVLIIEDDESVLDVLEQGIRRQMEEAEVFRATTGFEAGKLIGSDNPDLVIMDIMLPDIDGFEICSYIKENPKPIKIIAITGYGSEELREKILRAGADLYIEKPFGLKVLQNNIYKLFS